MAGKAVVAIVAGATVAGAAVAGAAVAGRAVARGAAARGITALATVVRSLLGAGVTLTPRAGVCVAILASTKAFG